MYRHPRKTPITSHYDWIEKINEKWNVEDFNIIYNNLKYFYEQSQSYEKILKTLPMEDLVKAFKVAFPESTVFFEDKEIK